MSRKIQKYKSKNFESRNQGSSFVNQCGKNQADTSANIFESMLQSTAFKSLTSKQKILYVYCKAQYYGKRKPKKTYEKQGLFQADEYFYFNIGLAEEYGLYKMANHKRLYTDLKALEKAGFIVCEKSGKGHKEKNVYCFSDEWKKRG